MVKGPAQLLSLRRCVRWRRYPKERKTTVVERLGCTCQSGSASVRPAVGGGLIMRRTITIFCGLVSLCAVLSVGAYAPALAQQPLKIGLIMPYSGQFTDTAAQMDNGVKLYMKQHGDVVAGRKIEIIRRDTGG